MLFAYVCFVVFGESSFSESLLCMNASTAALLIDLQVDFLDRKVGRMPVGENDASRVIAAAESVLAGRALTGALVLAIVNAFPRNQVFANMVRRYSALAGTPGAAIDPRLDPNFGSCPFKEARQRLYQSPTAGAMPPYGT